VTQADDLDRSLPLDNTESVGYYWSEVMDMTDYTRIELPACSRLDRCTDGAQMYQKFVDGRYVGIVRSVPPTHCGHCGGEKPAGQSCGCFDNDSQ
jgi:hypothetical protein